MSYSHQGAQGIGSPHPRDDQSLYRSYLFTEPFGRNPLSTDQMPVEDASLLEIVQKSAEHFKRHDRLRTVERLQLEMARLNMKNGEYESALQLLLDLWQHSSWRREGWWDILAGLDWALRECARQVGDEKTLVAVEWELLSSFSATFAFESVQGHVGINLPFQVVISSLAHENSSPIRLTHIGLNFKGGLRNVRIVHDDSAEDQTFTDKRHQFYTISLEKSTDNDLLGMGGLNFSPGLAKVFSLAALPLDAGEAKLSSITLYTATERFEFEVAISRDDELRQDHYWTTRPNGISRKPLQNERNLSAEILPKPPKMRIQLPDLAKSYFTSEHIRLDISIMNDEEEDSVVSLDVRLLGQEDELPFNLRWVQKLDEHRNAKDKKEDIDRSNPTAERSLTTVLGHMMPSEARKHTIHFQAKPTIGQCSLEIKARYHLLSEPETPISKTLTTDMLFMQPFEANFDFQPQISRDPWPDYFRLPDHVGIPNGEGPAEGLLQKWSMTAGVASFASQPLVLEAVELQVLAIHEKADCRITQEPSTETKQITLSPNDIHSRTFNLDLQKPSLDDRSTTYFDLRLQLTWRRDALSSPSTTAVLPIPELVIPFGEPRVLASAKLNESNPHLIDLDYTLENPSMHVLSFSVSMDASEEFAFSGPKATAVQLVPLSRHTVRYKLLPLVKGKWICPQVKIVDVHWNKILKPIPTGDMKSDRRGILVWADAED